MSNEMIYWLFIGAAFIVSSVLALVLMVKLDKMAWAFWVSFAVNAVITAAGCFWWDGLYTGVQRLFGIFGYWIAFANIEIILFFALFIMKKRKTNL
ncbi:hypothetical protein [Paenibacillus thalictri]|uniref:Uncharacterized protein n=1 Tax=Paenibacillus thalictri TaxID=2527873 RepID=A0A4Q9DYG1_9BACL|nr:hypothetical protein [Paenibacillus thalictri]TBL81140.1 hypothetical protein EYB31_03335 [Paenibacillus thalictri]